MIITFSNLFFQDLDIVITRTYTSNLNQGQAGLPQSSPWLKNFFSAIKIRCNAKQVLQLSIEKERQHVFMWKGNLFVRKLSHSLIVSPRLVFSVNFIFVCSYFPQNPVSKRSLFLCVYAVPPQANCSLIC